MIKKEEKEKIKSSQDLDFVAIVEDQKPEELESENDSDYSFYCKDCKAIVETDFSIFWWKKIYKCKTCWSERITLWFEKSLKKYYRI